LFGGTDAGICGSTGSASVTWSYDTHTGTGGQITTSPVLSLDGRKVAFIESLSSGSVLHVLRPKTSAINGTGTEGTVAAPVVPTTVVNSTDGGAAGNWSTCLGGTGSCMFNLVYNSTTNTNSSPFYNYSTDGTCTSPASAPCFGLRDASKFSSITDPPIFDGSTLYVHFFGISLGAGTPQVVQTTTTLGSAVTAPAGTATGSTPQMHAGAF